MRVAVATQDRVTADGHFASARVFMFFNVTRDSVELVDDVSFDVVTDEEGSRSGPEGGEDRLGAKLDAIRGSALMFITAIGGPAAARVVRNNVHPIKLTAPEPIDQVLARIQTMLRGNPPPWLRKIVASEGGIPVPEPRLRFSEDDGE